MIIDKLNGVKIDKLNGVIIDKLNGVKIDFIFCITPAMYFPYDLEFFVRNSLAVRVLFLYGSESFDERNHESIYESFIIYANFSQYGEDLELVRGLIGDFVNSDVQMLDGSPVDATEFFKSLQKNIIINNRYHSKSFKIYDNVRNLYLWAETTLFVGDKSGDDLVAIYDATYKLKNKTLCAFQLSRMLLNNKNIYILAMDIADFDFYSNSQNRAELVLSSQKSKTPMRSKFPEYINNLFEKYDCCIDVLDTYFCQICFSMPLPFTIQFCENAARVYWIKHNCEFSPDPDINDSFNFTTEYHEVINNERKFVELLIPANNQFKNERARILNTIHNKNRAEKANRENSDLYFQNICNALFAFNDYLRDTPCECKCSVKHPVEYYVSNWLPIHPDDPLFPQILYYEMDAVKWSNAIIRYRNMVNEENYDMNALLTYEEFRMFTLEQCVAAWISNGELISEDLQILRAEVKQILATEPTQDSIKDDVFSNDVIEVNNVDIIPPVEIDMLESYMNLIEYQISNFGEFTPKKYLTQMKSRTKKFDVLSIKLMDCFTHVFHCMSDLMTHRIEYPYLDA